MKHGLGVPTMPTAACLSSRYQRVLVIALLGTSACGVDMDVDSQELCTEVERSIALQVHECTASMEQANQVARQLEARYECNATSTTLMNACAAHHGAHPNEVESCLTTAGCAHVYPHCIPAGWTYPAQLFQCSTARRSTR